MRCRLGESTLPSEEGVKVVEVGLVDGWEVADIWIGAEEPSATPDPGVFGRVFGERSELDLRAADACVDERVSVGVGAVDDESDCNVDEREDRECVVFGDRRRVEFSDETSEPVGVSTDEVMEISEVDSFFGRCRIGVVVCDGLEFRRNRSVVCDGEVSTDAVGEVRFAFHPV